MKTTYDAHKGVLSKLEKYFSENTQEHPLNYYKVNGAPLPPMPPISIPPVIPDPTPAPSDPIPPIIPDPTPTPTDPIPPVTPDPVPIPVDLIRCIGSALYQ